MSTLTCHLVTRNPDAAAAWYTSVLGATEASRITLPGGQVLTIELRFGDSTLSISDEFPEMGIVSPLTLGGTYGALHLAVEDADAVLAAGTGGRRDRVRATARRVLGGPDRAVHRPVRPSLGDRPAHQGRAARGGRAAGRGGVRRGPGLGAVPRVVAGYEPGRLRRPGSSWWPAEVAGVELRASKWSGRGPFGVGGLDVLEEAAAHPEFLAGRRDDVPQARWRAEPGRPR